MTRTTVEAVPGGATSQKESIDDIIDHVDSGSPLSEELAEWMVHERFTEMESVDSARRVISFLDAIRILDQQGDQMQVGDAGTRWKLESSPETFFSILDEGAVGFETLLDRLARGDCSFEDLHTNLTGADEIDWETDSQTRRRLNYLRSCGLVDYDDGSYTITDDGEAVIQGQVDDDRFQEPPTIERFRSLIEESEPDLEIYLANHEGGTFDGDNLNLPIDTSSGINPREIPEEAVIFHLVGDEIRGFSRQSERGIDRDIDGTNHHRIPTETRFFDEPVYLHSVLGDLVDPDIRLETDSYSFSEIGLKDQKIGELGQAAASVILNEITADGHDTAWPDEYSLDDRLSPEDIEGLYYPENQLQEIVLQSGQALKNGKHLVLVGPPGTGKSKLAGQIASHFVDDDYKMVTATANWSTFDTIGGYQPEGDAGLSFVPGVFLERFKDTDGNPGNEWLIIDELNRANIDKAFGSLFSALVGDSVTTSFKDESDEEVEIISKEAAEGTEVQENQYCIPETWRLIATMNTQDKMSLYDLSYAFIRRFAFIHVGAPTAEELVEDDIEEYLDRWDIDTGDDEGELSDEFVSQLTEFWKTIQEHRKLGPALIEDITRALVDDKIDFTQPVKMFVIPQLEDLPRETQQDAIEAILEMDGDIDIDGEEIREFAIDYFGLSRSRLGDSA